RIMLLMRRAISACTWRASTLCASAARRSVRLSRATISARRRARRPSPRRRSSSAGGATRWLELASADGRDVAAIVVAYLEAVGARWQAAHDPDHLAVGAAAALAEIAGDRLGQRLLVRPGQHEHLGLEAPGTVVGDDDCGLARRQLDEGADREDADRLDELFHERFVERASRPFEQLHQRFLR